MYAAKLYRGTGCQPVQENSSARAGSPCHVMIARIAFVASLWLTLVGCNSTARPTSAVDRTRERESLTYLASDELEGRGVGTTGLDKAAEFIAEQFSEAGLKHAGSLDGYFQPFDVTTETNVSEKTTLIVDDAALERDEEFRPLGFSATKAFAGPVAFVGYGISSEKFKYDDYANVDVKGKIVFAMRYEPHDEKGKSRFEPKQYSNEATLDRKASVAADHGATALLVVTPKKHHEDDKLLPFVGEFMGGAAKIPVLQISQAVAESMLKSSGAPDLTAIQTKIDTSAAPSSLELAKVTVSGEVAFDRTTATVKNVVGLLPGRGKLKDEYVVVGAHYDHVGMGGPMSMARGVKQIHNGADDNASGTTVLIDLAEKLAQSKSPRRSILFVAFTGEEWGLLGSKHFVDHPPVPLDKIAAMLNLDMVGRVTKDTLFIGGRGTAEAFDSILARIDEQSPLNFKDIGRGGFGPSDHMSFAMHKIPVLFLFSGLHGDYHRPTDDVEKINFEGLREVTTISEKMIESLAAIERPAYVTTSDNTHYAIGSPTSAGGSGVTLGVVPDYSSDVSTGGSKISGTVPGSPAEAAGLQADDVIVKFNDRAIDNLYDLSQALADSKAGDKVTLKVRRAGEEIELQATLAKKAG